MSRWRSSSERAQDLELRLAPSCIPKGVTRSDCPELIVIEDDDDDAMQIHPHSLSAEAIRFYQYSASLSLPISEDDLELRLGIGGFNRNQGNSTVESTKVKFVTAKPDNEYHTAFMQPSSRQSISPSMEVRLKCAICMDIMKEETSTTCGHLFCKACITDAIRVQKRCPTCREKLSPNSIHRIYLPGATS